MNCYFHNHIPSSGRCNKCGRELCAECVNVFNPPTCTDCAKEWKSNAKKDAMKKGIFFVGLFIVGIVLGAKFYDNLFEVILLGFVLGCVPFGWRALNKMTSDIFLFLPLVGWGIYFLIKFVLSMVIGIFVAPFQIYSIVKDLKVATP